MFKGNTLLLGLTQHDAMRRDATPRLSCWKRFYYKKKETQSNCNLFKLNSNYFSDNLIIKSKMLTSSLIYFYGYGLFIYFLFVRSFKFSTLFELSRETNCAASKGMTKMYVVVFFSLFQWNVYFYVDCWLAGWLVGWLAATGFVQSL